MRLKRFLITLLSVFLLSALVIPQPSYASSLSSTKYTGTKVVKINKNNPTFTKKQKKLKKFSIKYSKLDKLGRCGKVTAVLTKKKMAKGSRGSIGMYKPSGWPEKIGNAKYDFIKKASAKTPCFSYGDTAPPKSQRKEDAKC